MALKVVDGYDHYNATADFLARSGFLQYQTFGNTNPNISFISGLSGFGKAIRLTLGGFLDGFLRFIYADRNAEAFCAWRIRFPQVTNAAMGGTLSVIDTVGGATQLTIVFNASNYTIQIFRGSSSGTSLFLSANNAWIGQTAIFVELGVKIDNSTGYVTLKIDGNIIANLTGIDTQSSANAWFDAHDFHPTTTNPSVTNAVMDIDDFNYCDTANGGGAVPCDTFLGDARVATLFATGNGTTIQWTPLANTNWQEVSEIVMDSDVSYNYSTNPGDEDLLAFAPINSSVTFVFGVQVTGAYRKDDAGVRIVKQSVNIGGTTYYGSNHSISAGVTYAYFSDMWQVTPNFSMTWDVTDVNVSQFGYNLVS